MKDLKVLLRFCAVMLFALVFISGCQKVGETYSIEKEAIQIKAWMQTMIDKKFNIDTTSTGLFYIVNKVGTGRKVVAGDTVTVQYSGMFLDGTVFDASSSFTYIHKATGQRMIQGWEEGIEVMNKGENAVFLIPSEKGYGSYGYGYVPPYTPLLYVIEMVDIK